MVIPVAFAVAAGAAVVKAKCAWMLGSKDVAKSNCNMDPWALKVDLTSTEDKRKAAQQKFESSQENVSKEREKMRAQAEILQKLEQERKAKADSDEEDGVKPPAPPRKSEARPMSGTISAPKASQRPLLCSASEGSLDESTSKVYFHQGLHSTGTVFVTPVDSTNAREFFAGNSPFKTILVTEMAETPAWYRQFASEHRAVCSFGETRCTDQLMMDLFGISAVEPLPVCIVASDTPRAVQYWRSKGLDLFSLGLVSDSPQAFCSGNMDPQSLCALMRQALSIPPRDTKANTQTQRGDGKGGSGVGTWCSQAP